jgi:hypothetical protein
VETTSSSLDSALQDPVPEMPNPLSAHVELQCGLYHNETWKVTAEVRELTGADEEYLAAVEAKSDLVYAEYMTALLKRAVISIDDVSVQEHPEVIDQLIISDRDLLFIGIIKATYGREREFTTRCPSCREQNNVVLNVDDDFPVQTPTVNLQKPLEIKLKSGYKVKLRMPNGVDSAYVGKQSTSIASQNTMMIARCSVWEDGKKPDDLEEWAKSLGIADRSKLIKALTGVKAGPKMEGVNVQCAHCGYDMPIRVDWISLLFS